MADLDGDGFSETGVFFNGEWRIDMNGDGVWDKKKDLAFGKFGGEPGDRPVIENIR